jgi:hypothetical protein
MDRWPNSVLQFEDFSNEHALALLERYRNFHLVFNDDIQGTAATALAGLYGAMRRLVRRCCRCCWSCCCCPALQSVLCQGSAASAAEWGRPAPLLPTRPARARRLLQGKPASELAKQRVVCVGAGSAGMGVVRMIAAGGRLGGPGARPPPPPALQRRPAASPRASCKRDAFCT